jgi:hypothetical protein
MKKQIGKFIDFYIYDDSNTFYRLNSTSLRGTWSSNRHSKLAFMKDLLPKYFSSEWSFAHCQVPMEHRCICGFGPERNSIIGKCIDE